MIDVSWLNALVSTETPFFLLFAVLFYYVIKRNKEREERLTNEIKNELMQLKQDQAILINVWKILLEQELERRAKK